MYFCCVLFVYFLVIFLLGLTFFYTFWGGLFLYFLGVLFRYFFVELFLVAFWGGGPRAHDPKIIIPVGIASGECGFLGRGPTGPQAQNHYTCKNCFRRSRLVLKHESGPTGPRAHESPATKSACGKHLTGPYLIIEDPYSAAV